LIEQCIRTIHGPGADAAREHDRLADASCGAREPIHVRTAERIEHFDPRGELDVSECGESSVVERSRAESGGGVRDDRIELLGAQRRLRTEREAAGGCHGGDAVTLECRAHGVHTRQQRGLCGGAGARHVSLTRGADASVHGLQSVREGRKSIGQCGDIAQLGIDGRTLRCRGRVQLASVAPREEIRRGRRVDVDRRLIRRRHAAADADGIESQGRAVTVHREARFGPRPHERRPRAET
jgi:hypothetical protein